MDFFYRQNLNRSDFLSSFQTSKLSGEWVAVAVGYPTVVFDLTTVDVFLTFFRLETRRDPVKQSLTGFTVTAFPETGILLFNKSTERVQLALAFADPEFMATFHLLLHKLLIRSDLTREGACPVSHLSILLLSPIPDEANQPHFHSKPSQIPDLPD